MTAAPAPSKDAELAKGVHARAAPAVRDTLDRLVKEMQTKQQGVDDLMKRLDSNKDGKLGRKELSDGLRTLGITLLPSELDEVMKVFDKDGTGNVDYVEFYAVIREWKAPAAVASTPAESDRVEVSKLAPEWDGVYIRAAADSFVRDGKHCLVPIGHGVRRKWVFAATPAFSIAANTRIASSGRPARASAAMSAV